MFETLGITCERGQQVNGRAVLGELRDGSQVTLAVQVLHGAKEGPVVSLTGAVHGDEPVGPATINRLMATLEPQEVSGTIIGFPVANPFAVITKSRISGVDYERLNLNRVFPGNANGLITERVAAAIFDGGIRKANYHLDYHEGGYDFIARYLIAQNQPDQPEVSAESLRLAKAFGMGVPINHLTLTPEALTLGRAGTSTGQAAAIGVPALTAELGGAGRVWPDHAETAYQGTCNVLKEVGVLSGDKVTVDQEQPIGLGGQWPRPSRGGWWEQVVELGQIVEAGQKLGHVKNAFGEIVEELHAPYRAVIFDIRNTAMIMTGEWTVHCGRLDA
jgi:predicted deacylase